MLVCQAPAVREAAGSRGRQRCQAAGPGVCRYFREGFQKATADLVERELQRFERPEEVEIFFSAHGVPVSYVEQARALDHISNIPLACVLWLQQVMPRQCVWSAGVGSCLSLEGCICAHLVPGTCRMCGWHSRG